MLGEAGNNRQPQVRFIRRCDVNLAAGGDADAAGFTLSTSANTGIVLGFSLTAATIPAGCGTLVELDITGDATGLSGIVVSDAVGSALAFEYFVGGSGDVDGNGSVDVLDLVGIVGNILGTDVLDECAANAADIADLAVAISAGANCQY